MRTKNYQILEMILRLMWIACEKEKRQPNLKEINMFLEAMQIVTERKS